MNICGPPSHKKHQKPAHQQPLQLDISNPPTLQLSGNMPAQFRIADNALIVPRVRKEDAGTYRCIVDAADGQHHVAHVELDVAGELFK